MRLIDADTLPNYDCLVTAKVGEMSSPAKMRFVFWKDIVKATTIEAIPRSLCNYNPPSSCDGKPCCMCPAIGKEG